MRERFEAILDPDRVIDHPLERRLYSRDGSIAMGDAGLVVLPETTAEVVDCVRLAARAGRPGGAARLGHRPVRRRRPPRRGDRAVRGADDPHPRRQPGGAVRPRRARRAQPGPVGGRPAPGPALRARPLEPAGMLHRRQRRDQRRRARTAWRRASPRSTSWAWRSCWPTARCSASAAPRPTAGLRPARLRGGRRGDARRGDRGDGAADAHPLARADDAARLHVRARGGPGGRGTSSAAGSSRPRWR